MALKTYNQTMAMARGNYVNPPAVSSVTTSGISAFEYGFAASNLEYEDPWTMMKTASISGQPIITHTFASSIGPTVLGLLNHNFYSAGYSSVAVEYWTGSSWSTIGTITLASTDSDLIIPWDNSFSTTQMRWKLNAAAGNFFIGSVFYGLILPFDSNPTASGVTQVRRSPIVIEQSAGGSRHVSFGATRRTSDMTLIWERGTSTDRGTFEQLNYKELVGFVTPEHGDAVQTVAIGDPIFWGYVEEIVASPRGPGMHLTGQPATYDFTVFLSGAS